MANNTFNPRSLGQYQPSVRNNPITIVSTRAPLATDTAPIGQLWVNTSANTAYILTSIVASAASWQLLEAASSGGTINIGTTGVTAVTIGSLTGASSLTLHAGTGNMTLDGAAATNITVGASLTSGAISIGGTAESGAITLGNSSAAQVVAIADGAGASIVDIAANQVSGTVAIGGSMTTGTVTIGSTAAQTGTITIAPGTGAQTIAIANANTGVKTLHIADGTVANVVTIGSTTGAATTTINGGTGGIALTAPFVKLPGPIYVYTGVGAPSNGLALHIGDLYINNAATTATDRMFIATAAGIWTNFTCAA